MERTVCGQSSRDNLDREKARGGKVKGQSLLLSLSVSKASNETRPEQAMTELPGRIILETVSHVAKELRP
jgi:hypothetical protein